MTNKIRIIIEADGKQATQEVERFGKAISGGMGKAGSEVKKAESAMLTFAKALGVAYGASRTLKGVWDNAKIGAQAEQQFNSFRIMLEGVDMDIDRFIDSMQRASAETVDMATLVNKAGTAMLLGIDPSKMTKLMEIARASSRVTGQTVSQAFADISLAVGRQSRMILDNLGIIVKVEDANRKYAEALGKTEAQLTEADRKQAFMNATMEAGEEIIRKVNVQQTSSYEKALQVEARLKDIADTVRTALIPTLESWAEWLKNIDWYWSKILSPRNENQLVMKNLQNQLKTYQNELAEMQAVKMESGGLDKVLGWMPGYITQEEADRAIPLLKKRIETIQKSITNMVGEEKLQKIDKELGDFFEGITAGAPGGLEEPVTWLDKYLEGIASDDKIDKLNEAFFGSLDEQENYLNEKLNDETEKRLKQAEQRKDIERDITDEIKRLTLSEKDYKEWALSEEIKALEKYAEGDKELLDKITGYHLLKLKEISDENDNMNRKMSDAFESWLIGWSGRLSEMVWGAKASFDEILTAFGKMLTEMIIKSHILEPLAKGFGGFIGNMFSFGTLAGAGGGFAGAGGTAGLSMIGGRAGGGGVHPFKDYIVGEDGPEILRMGSRGGTVVPNQAMTGRSDNVNINFSIIAMDSMSFSRAIDGHRAQIVNIIQGAYDRRGRNGGPVK